MALRVPLRQLGTGLPSLGSLDIPIEANPVADAVETATKLLIGTKVWAFGGGTEVVANPGGTGLLTLSTITIDGVPYAISGMGGGGGSDGVTESIDFAKVGDTITATIGRSGGLGEVTGSFDVFSGAYADLTGQPPIPAAQVQTDWDVTSGLGQILNQPRYRRCADRHADLHRKHPLLQSP